jgi:hypothetical protein
LTTDRASHYRSGYDGPRVAIGIPGRDRRGAWIAARGPAAGRAVECLGVGPDAADGSEEVAQLGDVGRRPSSVRTAACPERRFGRRLAERAGGDRLGQREWIGGLVSVVVGRRSASAICAATRFRPR